MVQVQEEEEEERRFFVRSMSLRALWRLVRLWDGEREVVGNKGGREAGRGGCGADGKRHVSSLSPSLSLALSLSRFLALSLSLSLSHHLLSPRHPPSPGPHPSVSLFRSISRYITRSLTRVTCACNYVQGSRNCSQLHVRPRKVPSVPQQITIEFPGQSSSFGFWWVSPYR